MFDTYEWDGPAFTESSLHDIVRYHEAKYRQIVCERAKNRFARENYCPAATIGGDTEFDITTLSSSNGQHIKFVSNINLYDRFKHGMISIRVNRFNEDIIPHYLGKYMLRSLMEKSVMVFHNRRQGDYGWNRHFTNELTLAASTTPHFQYFMASAGIVPSHCSLHSIRILDDQRQFRNMMSLKSTRNIKLIILNDCQFIPATRDESPDIMFLEFLNYNPDALIISIMDTSCRHDSIYSLEHIVTQNFFRNSTTDKDDLWKNDIEEEEYDENY